MKAVAYKKRTMKKHVPLRSHKNLNKDDANFKDGERRYPELEIQEVSPRNLRKSFICGHTLRKISIPNLGLFLNSKPYN